MAKEMPFSMDARSSGIMACRSMGVQSMPHWWAVLMVETRSFEAWPMDARSSGTMAGRGPAGRGCMLTDHPGCMPQHAPAAKLRPLGTFSTQLACTHARTHACKHCSRRQA